MRLLQSLSHGLSALDYMREQDGPVRLTDLAASLNVEKSKAWYILKTLVAAGYAEQDVRRHYRATEKIVAPPGRPRSLEEIIACKEAWRPSLEQLAGETSECAHLAVLVKSWVWHIDKIASPLPLSVNNPIGWMAPLHCTALGKAFLSFGVAEPEEPLKAYTARTIVSTVKLRKETRLTRTRGYAVDNEEFHEGIRCVARPIFDRKRRMIAAIGVSGPSVRIHDERVMELGELMCSISVDGWWDGAH